MLPSTETDKTTERKAVVVTKTELRNSAFENVLERI